MTNKQIVNLKVNGDIHELLVHPTQTLLQVLREQLRLTGTKCGCNNGVCGSCTISVDGQAVRACLSLAIASSDKDITTIEGLEENGKLQHLQEAFVDKQGLQCGFCTPGMIMSARALLQINPNPSIEEIREELSGNLCRCTGYVKIADAVMFAIEGEQS
jgi:aerobic-type carbon monoxide dehydrogenase small subunit (CoxS/CutS family)